MCLNNKICPICSQVFFKSLNESKKAWESRHKFCSRKCSDLAKIGGKQTDESNEKRRKWSTGRKHTPETRLKFTGENAPGWKGGITAENNKIRSSPEYKEWRKAVFERDNYTCVHCGARNGNGKTIVLNADHIKPFAYFPELRLELSNGRTLCIDCHRKTDTYRRKPGYKYSEEQINKLTKAREASGVYERISTAVRQIDIQTGEILNTFRSINSASKQFNKKNAGQNIRAALGLINGKNKTNHAYNYKWELVHPEKNKILNKLKQINNYGD